MSPFLSSSSRKCKTDNNKIGKQSVFLAKKQENYFQARRSVFFYTDE